MLVLTRKPGEIILIGEDIQVQVLGVRSDGEVRLGFLAPKKTNIIRKELKDKLEADGVEVKMEKPSRG